MAHDEPKNGVARCSFCGKPETLVHKLIEGPVCLFVMNVSIFVMI